VSYIKVDKVTDEDIQAGMAKITEIARKNNESIDRVMATKIVDTVTINVIAGTDVYRAVEALLMVYRSLVLQVFEERMIN